MSGMYMHMSHVETAARCDMCMLCRYFPSLWDTEEGRVDWRRVRVSAAMGCLQRNKALQPWALAKLQLARAVLCEFVMHSYGLAPWPGN